MKIPSRGTLAFYTLSLAICLDPQSGKVFWQNNNFLFGSRLCLRVQKMRAEIIMRGRADWNVEPTNEHGEMTKTFW